MPKLALTSANFKWIASRLSPSVEPEMVMAVAAVECKREPFYRDGFPTILFERHIFWRHAPISRRTEWRKAYPQICNPDSTPKGGYGSSASQRTKFNTAFNLDKDAAMMACSWGAFQELGANFEDYGFANVGEFVDEMKNGLFGQANIFIKSIIKRRLVQAFVDRKYAVIAKNYNGPGYRTFNYDGQIKEEYLAAKKQKIQWRDIDGEPPPASLIASKTSSAAASQNGKPEVITETKGAGLVPPPATDGSLSSDPPPIGIPIPMPTVPVAPQVPDGSQAVVVERGERTEIKEGFFKRLWLKIVGGATALGGVDAITDKAQQAQALGLPTSFWTRLFYVLIALAVAWILYEIWTEVIQVWLINRRKRQRTQDLMAANQTADGLLALARTEDLAAYEAKGWTVVRRG